MLFRQPVWGRSDYPLDLNPAEVSLFRLWLQCAGVSLFVVALLGFSLLVAASSFCQNATLESFTGDGFGRFGLESCWGSSVSHACRRPRRFRGSAPKKWVRGFRVSDACPTEPFDEPRVLRALILRALILVVASSFVCGCIASSFCFFRPAERNVRQFYGRWFWQVWAWILLAFPCFGCMPHRALWRGIGFRLWLQCAGVSLFVVALLGFALLVVASSFCFFRPSERNVREFYGGWFWQVWAWILLGFFCFACMPHRALWLPLEAWILPGFAMVLLCF